MSPNRRAADAAVAFLGELTDRLELDLTVGAGPEDGGAVIVQFTGADADRLKGNGALVEALGRLASQVASKAAEGRVDLVLDVGGDFDARRALLQQAADEIARSVVVSGRRAVIEGLSSTERKVMHTRLADDDAVATRSEGESYARRLLVERA